MQAVKPFLETNLVNIISNVVELKKNTTASSDQYKASMDKFKSSSFMAVVLSAILPDLSVVNLAAKKKKSHTAVNKIKLLLSDGEFQIVSLFEPKAFFKEKSIQQHFGPSYDQENDLYSSDISRDQCRKLKELKGALFRLDEFHFTTSTRAMPSGQFKTTNQTARLTLHVKQFALVQVADLQILPTYPLLEGSAKLKKLFQTLLPILYPNLKAGSNDSIHVALFERFLSFSTDFEEKNHTFYFDNSTRSRDQIQLGLKDAVVSPEENEKINKIICALKESGVDAQEHASGFVHINSSNSQSPDYRFVEEDVRNDIEECFLEDDGSSKDEGYATQLLDSQLNHECSAPKELVQPSMTNGNAIHEIDGDEKNRLHTQPLTHEDYDSLKEDFSLTTTNNNNNNDCNTNNPDNFSNKNIISAFRLNKMGISNISPPPPPSIASTSSSESPSSGVHTANKEPEVINLLTSTESESENSGSTRTEIFNGETTESDSELLKAINGAEAVKVPQELAQKVPYVSTPVSSQNYKKRKLIPSCPSATSLGTIASADEKFMENHEGDLAFLRESICKNRSFISQGGPPFHIVRSLSGFPKQKSDLEDSVMFYMQ